MRDEVCPGGVARIVQELETIDKTFDFSNKHLSAYAEELVERLTRES